MTDAASVMGVSVEAVDAGNAVIENAELAEPATRGPLAEALVGRSEAGRPAPDSVEHTADTTADGALDYTVNGPSSPLTSRLDTTVHGPYRRG